MEILDASTPAGTSSSSNKTLWGNPALFLKTIFSPGATEKLPGTKAKAPSSLPSKTSMAMALPDSIAVAAVAITAAPTCFREALMASLGVVVAGSLAVVMALEVVAPADFRPVNDGMATAVEATVAIINN